MVTRTEMFNTLIYRYHISSGINKSDIIHHYNCVCTDCNGYDATSPCKVEQAYYDSNVVENVVYHTQL